MSDVQIILAPESVDAIARRVLELQGKIVHRPELSRAEVMQLTGHRSQAALTAWLTARKVRPISRGRYRRTAILRALGA